MRKEILIMGYTRGKDGHVVRKSLRPFSGTLTTGCGSGTANTSQQVIELTRSNRNLFGRVSLEDGIITTTEQFKLSEVRIRRLTPRECFRLMGVDDTDIDKIQASGISDSQQYKMAGNSIVVDVLVDIFRNLLTKQE